ncbi:MAG TPA: hypothetical protein VER96_09300 [Polyangiaceae bacterium]|nr:hypothetical protein [Polyangiaceae bacterium]
MPLGAHISFAKFGLLAPLLGFIACSGTDSGVGANENGLPHGSAGMVAVGGATNASGPGGKTGAGGVANIAGFVSFGGSVASAGIAGVNPSLGAGGTSGAGTGGLMSGTAGSGPAGGTSNAGGSHSGGNLGAAGSSAAFAKVSMILGSNCGIKGCHADKQSPHFVPGPMLHETLTAATVLAECGYTKLVEAGDPAKSAIVRLMNRQCDGFTMPPSCNKTPCLATADLQALSDWIQAGAPP